MKKDKREQEGVMHVYFRANGRYTVFYDDEDNLELLYRMCKFADKYDTRIMEFALMVNHAHFLVNTGGVTQFMREALKSYSRWYNAKYKNSNKIFHTPFSSATKKSEQWALESSVYILQNPVKAHMCNQVEDYKWSSATLHFPDRKYSDNRKWITRKRIEEVITVDTSFVDSYFKDYEEFLKFANYNPINFSSVIPKDSFWQTSTFENLYAEYLKIMNGRILNNLSKSELKEVVLSLRARTNAKMLQIASLLHVDYKFVRNLCNL